MTHIRILVAALLLIVGAPLAAQPAVTAFVRVNVLPMDSERALRDQTVLVSDGRIQAIGPRLDVPDGARVIDGGGSAWLLPGLADMHVHVGTRDELALLLANGITAALDMGEAPNAMVGRTRAAVARGDVPGPRLFVALAVDGSPRYGHLVVATPEAARWAVRLGKANGYDKDTIPAGAVNPQVMTDAHAADLGLAFYTGKQFPAKYQNGFFSAQHGSWNRSKPIGARVLFTSLKSDGTADKTEIFADGWLDETGAYRGRPLVRVILDRRLRMPSTARVLSTLSAGPVIIMSTPAAVAANQHRARELASAGATIAVPGGGDGDAFLHRALKWLLDADVTSVLVEGGPTLHAAFWRAGLVDKVELYVAPRPVGPDGVAWFDIPDGALVGLLDRTTVPVGEDVLVQGYVHRID